MTADPEKKRRWFQVHLSTACVMMFVGGIWVALNFRPPFFWGDIVGGMRSWPVYGFPFGVYCASSAKTSMEYFFDYDNLWGNGLIVFASLLFTATFFEYAIKRSARSPRPWFRLHGRTLFLLATFASILLTANFLPWSAVNGSIESGLLVNPYICIVYGWPWPSWIEAPVQNRIGPIPSGAVDNAMVAIVVLITVAFLCETLIRRRERKQQEWAE